MNLSKRMKSLAEIVDRDKFYDVNAGLELVKKTAKAKFDESRILESFRQTNQRSYRNQFTDVRATNS